MIRHECRRGGYSTQYLQIGEPCPKCGKAFPQGLPPPPPPPPPRDLRGRRVDGADKHPSLLRLLLRPTVPEVGSIWRPRDDYFRNHVEVVDTYARYVVYRLTSAPTLPGEPHIPQPKFAPVSLRRFHLSYRPALKVPMPKVRPARGKWPIEPPPDPSLTLVPGQLFFPEPDGSASLVGLYMPADMGVIQPPGFGVPLVYRLRPTGEVESVQQLGGPFLDLTPALIAAVEADRAKRSQPKESA